MSEAQAPANSDNTGAPAARRGRLAIVVQRYGAEVNGGAEGHARALARVLLANYDIDVLSSRAIDYQTWAPHYPAGESWLDGCRVLRFDHPARARRGRQHMPLRHKLRWRLRRWLARAGQPEVAQPNGNDHHDGLDYLRDQGPTMPGLLAHLAEHGDGYDAVIFFTALFHPTACGVLVQPERSLLVPTLHDEKPMFLPHFHRVFRAPRCILFNTASEAALARRLYGDDLPPQLVCGLGVDIPGDAARAADRAALPALQQRWGLRQPYLLYLGRVDSAKGCDRLFDYHLALPAALRARLPLVVAGHPVIPVPAHADIIATGFVGEAERDALLEGALALVNPSPNESLSLVVLEAMARGKPVLVNGGCAVLADHVTASGTGACFHDARSYGLAVQALNQRDAASQHIDSTRAEDYVARHYSWPAVQQTLSDAIATVVAGCSPHIG
jgi:glycosyltransferase involved in cell wall biosynthesis